MKELAEIVRQRQAYPRQPFALATVVEVIGSSYRQPGARMLIGLQGRVHGSISGGCLEKDVITKGIKVIIEEKSQLAVYDTSDPYDHWWGTSLGCGGTIKILIEPLLPHQSWPLAEAWQTVESTKTRQILGTAFAGRYQEKELTGAVCVRAIANEFGVQLAERPVFGPLGGLLQDLDGFETGPRARTGHYEIDGSIVSMLLERLEPTIPFYVFGGGIDAQPLVRMARELGYRIIVVDRRIEMSQAQNFPEAEEVHCLQPYQAHLRLSLPEGAVIMIMNHHYETDLEILGMVANALPTYVGVLGPKHRMDRLIQDLQDRGQRLYPHFMERLHSPAGLDLGAEGPEQIALSILAEIQMVLANRSGQPLGRRAAPIHEESDQTEFEATSPSSLLCVR